MAKRTTKGIFGGARAGGVALPVARDYVIPRSRRREVVVGLLLCGAIVAVLGVLFFFRGSRIVARAPLSSHHATFETSCGSCHTTVGRVADAGCLACHERSGERGVFDFAAHVAAHGGAATATDEHGPEAVPCASCHPEHHGRDGVVVAAADALCLGCHQIGSFSTGHPEHRFARAELVEEANLTFPHRFHVDRLRKDKGWEDSQRACLYCHAPAADGRGFLPLDFERGCGECHLTAGTATPRLPIGDPADPESPGVLTLEAIRASGRPGTRWSWFQNPDELRVSGSAGQRNAVQKRPVYHADPWVLENLRRIRETLHPDLGLGGLLQTAVEAGSGADGRVLAAEAVAALRVQVEELRGRPEAEVQEELERLKELLATVESRLAAGEGLEVGELAVPATSPLPPARAAALEELASNLTTPCRRCHVVSSGAILRVEQDQRVLQRAEFSHRAHVLLVPFCVDCHGAIPSLASAEAPADDPLDRAETLNLPRIAACRECHSAELASESCTTCHRFHPDGENRLAGLTPRPSPEGP